jgi:hypothetical protein
VVNPVLAGSRLLTLAALCSCQLACSSVAGTSPSAAPSADTAAAWQLNLSVTGGFAGLSQRFTVAADGRTLVVADAKRGGETPVPLTEPEQQELRRSVVERAALPDVDLRSATCRDCYDFELTMTAGQTGKARRIHYDSATMDASPEASLIERVLAIGRSGLARAAR